MRKLPFLTIGSIVEELKSEGLDLQPISIKRRERDIVGFPKVQRFTGDWRRYTRTQVDLIKRLLKKYYKFEPS